jgi:outer membrane protein insertion porin family
MQKYYVTNVGSPTRIGGQVQLGFPVMGSRSSRLFLSYGAEKVTYSDSGAGTLVNCQLVTCSRSTLGLSFDHDTRIGMPFPTDGGHQTLSAQLNGILGGARYTRYTGEIKHYTSLMQFGGSAPGSEPVTMMLGLSARAGALFGDPGGFALTQEFALGGVQYGEPLRGYEEFSITPTGYNPNTSQTNASLTSFGKAFYTNTVELGLRFNQMFYTDLFYDAGNIYATPQDFNPTRLFRGAGIGASVVTPLGPLGLDWAYGFDRVVNGVKAPKWMLHFRLGQLF